MKKPENSEYKYIFYIISVWHLIISNESRRKNITTYISNILDIEYYFQKIHELETNLKTVHHSNVDNSWSIWTRET